METNTMLNYKFNTYETKAYVYCASMGKPVLVQPLGEFDTRSIFFNRFSNFEQMKQKSFF